MARIVIGIEAAGSAETAKRFLEQAGHQVTAVAGPEPGSESGRQLAEELIGIGPDLVVLDYHSRDAGSVKAMQVVRDHLPFTQFIFLLPGLEVGLDHLAMAMSEGASALLAEPLNGESLGNYVQRALTRQKKEKKEAEELDHCRYLIEREQSCLADRAEEISRQRRMLHLSFRLINRLLAESAAGRKPWKVLLVSDSPYQLELFRRHLGRVGFEVLTAPDGRQGLETAKAHQPRIIVSDLEMPGLNGLELCREIKNHDALSATHFVISTANADRIDDVMNPLNKVDDCLLKPRHEADYEEFVGRVALGLLI